MKSLEQLIEERHELTVKLDNEEISLESFKVSIMEIDDKMRKIVKRNNIEAELRVKRNKLDKAYQKGINVSAELRHVNNQLNCVRNGLVAIHVHNPSELELIEEADLVHANYGFDIVPLHSYILDSTTLQILVDEYHETMSNLKQY